MFGGGWQIIIFSCAIIICTIWAMLHRTWAYASTLPIFSVLTTSLSVFWIFRIKYPFGGTHFGWGLATAFAGGLLAIMASLVWFIRFGRFDNSIDDDEDDEDDEVSEQDAHPMGDDVLTGADPNELSEYAPDEHEITHDLDMEDVDLVELTTGRDFMFMGALIVLCAGMIFSTFHSWTILVSSVSHYSHNYDGLSAQGAFGGWLVIILSGVLILFALIALAIPRSHVSRAAHVVAASLLTLCVFFGVRILTLFGSSKYFTIRLGWGLEMCVGFALIAVSLCVFDVLMSKSTAIDFEHENSSPDSFVGEIDHDTKPELV